MTGKRDGTGGGRRRIRTLTETEEALWREVTRSVSRLPGKASPPAAKPPAAPPAETPAPGKPAGKTTPRPPGPAPAPPQPPRHRGLPDIDRRMRRKLARGTQPIEARIDLHGKTQEEAHRRLRAFLADAQASGLTHVLVITGKGRGEGNRGVLRRAVPHWLSGAAFNRLVAGFGEAHPTHGGEGALYVRIRRPDRKHRP